jgi:hypothetical protein
MPDLMYDTFVLPATINIIFIFQNYKYISSQGRYILNFIEFVSPIDKFGLLFALKKKDFKMRTIILVFSVLFAAHSFAQMNEVKNALESSNASSLSGYFASSVELTLGDKEGFFSKNQAREMVSDFFMKNQPARFVQKHQSETGTSKCLIGQYIARAAQYRLTVIFKHEGNMDLIKTLKIEQE